MSKKVKRMIPILLVMCLLLGMIPSTIVPNKVGAAAGSASAVGALLDSYASANGYTYSLSSASRMYIVSSSQPTGELLQTVQLAQQQFSADGYSLDIVWGKTEDGAKDGDIVIKLVSGIADEGYQMNVTTKAQISASDTDGLLYGLNMLQKMIRNAGTSISGFTAADAPDTKERTVHLDCARKYLTKNWICNFVRQMSWMGYNALQLHLSEDGGFRADFWDSAYYVEGEFEPKNDFSWLCGSHTQSWTHDSELTGVDYRVDPDAGKYLTTAELVEILETCKEYHIEVIPSFDSPSHMDYITWKFEQNYQDNNSYRFTYNDKPYKASDTSGCINYSGRTGDSYPSWPYYTTMDIRDNTTRGQMSQAFVFALYEDMADFFSCYAGSTKFNIGGDEVNLTNSNISGTAWSYSEFPGFVNELNGILNGKGYTCRMFNDFIKADYLSQFADNIEICFWLSPHNTIDNSTRSETMTVAQMVADGRTLYNCINTNTYYVLRINDTEGDARSEECRQWEFYHSDETHIYNEWYPADISAHGEYSEDTADVSASQLGGGYFLIWNDYSAVNTEVEMWNGVYDAALRTGEFYSLLDRMWSNSIKQWNSDINSKVTLANYATVRDSYGDFPGLGSGTSACSEATVLPAVDSDIDCGHNYVSEYFAASCISTAKVNYTCSYCGHSYTEYPDGEWYENKPDVAEELIETKTQYRYSDYETITSTATSMAGWDQVSNEWVESGTGSVLYVDNWTGDCGNGSDIPSTNALYTTYNNKDSTISAYENSTAKRVITSRDTEIGGYIWYHWCYDGGSYYIRDHEKSDIGYNTFTAFYSTAYDPANLTKSNDRTKIDFDDLYYYVISGAPVTCVGYTHDGFWYIPVYKLIYTDYEKVYTYERWTDYSDWSDTPVTASDTRQVETRTVYRDVSEGLADHSWADGVCSVCNTVCVHSYVDQVCTVCGMVQQHTYVDGVCTECGEACEHSYVNGVCRLCNMVCGHSWADGTCTTCGLVCDHSWESGKCTVCGTECAHAYDENTGICTVCGLISPDMSYYIIGTINGTTYTAEGIAANPEAYAFLKLNEDGVLDITLTEAISGLEICAVSDGEVVYKSSGFSDYSNSTGAGDLTFWLTLLASGSRNLEWCVHQWDEGTVIQAPTCTESGVLRYACTGTTVDKNICTCTKEVALPAGHTWVDGVCSGCGESCVHSFADGLCTVCGYVCPHNFVADVCITCGMDWSQAAPDSNVILFKTMVNGAEYQIGWQSADLTQASFNIYIPVQKGYVYASCADGTFTELPSRDGSGYLRGSSTTGVVTVWYDFVGDYDRLQDLIDAYPTAPDYDYTDASWAAYKTALDTAKAFYGAKSAVSQAQINGMVRSLQAAHAALVTTYSGDSIIHSAELLYYGPVEANKLACVRVVTSPDVEELTVFGPAADGGEGEAVVLLTMVSSAQILDGEVIKVWLIDWQLTEAGTYTIHAGDATATV